MAENPLMQDFVGNVCECGFSPSNNTARGLYDDTSHHTEWACRRNGAMSALALQFDFKFIVVSFPGTSYTDPTMSDIGGGCGNDASERAHKQSERMFGRGADITLEFFGSHERTVEEWRKLLRAADPRSELVNINRAPNKPNTILEVAWIGQDLGG
ncbi:MAG: hypothetical protein ASARMPREDX12_009223 [Alectoria sarmentosa]|nr:MAG: hypothetical protein ASARMPREDX12_009223 [Alectoria sarmentosa]